MEGKGALLRIDYLAFVGSFLLSARLAYAVDGPLSPQQSLAYFKTEPGLKVELVASEPMVVDPVALAWDERGRLFVVENRDYPIGPGRGKPPQGQVVMLEDTDGDGKYDRRTVYVDGLTFPNGVMPWKGGIFVTCAPYLYYFKDTKGDGIADLKQVVFKGFHDLSTTQLRVSHPTLNLDNWVYLTSGLTSAKVSSPQHTNRPAITLDRIDARFRPDTLEIEPAAGTSQFGQTFDRFGRKFLCSNRNHIQQVVLEPRYLKRNPHLGFSETVEDIPDHEAASRLFPVSANITTAAFHTGYFTSACGVTIFGGTALPTGYAANSFTCEPAGNLVHRDVLVPNGVTSLARRAYSTNEFLASQDNWVRPVFLANSPDGALYLCDMYRKTIEHPNYLPEATRKLTDFESGKGMGRIYRVVAQNQPQKKSARIDLTKATGAKLVSILNNSNVWWRMTAQRLLLERKDLKAVSSLKKLSTNGKTPEARIHAYRTLDALNALSDNHILSALKDKEAAVREHGIQLAESRLANSPALSAQLLLLADDPDSRVRFQCALSLGEINEDTIIRALVKIAARNLDDKWTRAAVLTAIANREELFLHGILPVIKAAKSECSPAFMEELGRELAASLAPDRLAVLLEEILESQQQADLAWQMAAVGGAGEGLRQRGYGKGGSSSLLYMTRNSKATLRPSLEYLIQRAMKVAVNSTEPIQSRLAAIKLLAQWEYTAAERTLDAVIEPGQPSEVQTAAIHAFGQMGEAKIGPALVTRARWSGYTPGVRETALTALTANTNLLHCLLNAVEAGNVPIWTINTGHRNRLMKHSDETIKSRANKLFANMQPGDRMKAYEESKLVLTLESVSANGRAVFRRNCATCHVFAGEGKTVGPDLTGIRNQPRDVILLHIVVPEKEINPIYTCYTVELKDGESLTGLLAAETSSAISLRMTQDVQQRILRTNIATITTSRLSFMPQELEKAMTRQELADLIAYLKGE